MIDRFEHMELALAAAEEAAKLGEVPIGAVVTGPDGRVLAVAHNRVISTPDPAAHAEILALREAAQKLGSERLTDCDLWTTLEPCPMCAQAISFARIRRLYYGADDPKGGGLTTRLALYSQDTVHHKPEVYSGIAEERAAALLLEFFRARRD